MATTNQKSTIDGHTKKKVQSKHNTKGSLQITKEENKRGRGEKDLQKQTKNNKMSISAGVQPRLIQGIRRRDGIGEGQETTA